MHPPARGTRIAACCVLGAALLLAQPDWKTVVKLLAVDLGSLSPVGRRRRPSAEEVLAMPSLVTGANCPVPVILALAHTAGLELKKAK